MMMKMIMIIIMILMNNNNYNNDNNNLYFTRVTQSNIGFDFAVALFFDSLDTQKFRSGFPDDDYSLTIVHVVSLLQFKQSGYWPIYL